VSAQKADAEGDAGGTQRGRFKPVRIGLLVAAVVAGPPLWRLVRDGSMDSLTALERGGLVALVCALGVSWLGGIVADYQRDVRLARLIRAHRQALAQGQPAEPKGGKARKPPAS
jgi:hypothetical protein